VMVMVMESSSNRVAATNSRNLEGLEGSWKRPEYPNVVD
jgi:hypothetical protein